MYILKQGNISRTKKYKKFVCKECGCELVADNTEYCDCSSQRDGPAFRFLGICPTCGNDYICDFSYDLYEGEIKE